MNPSDMTLKNIFSPNCSGTSTALTAGIIDPVKVKYFLPLGEMLTSHITPIDHIYVTFPDVNGSATAQPAGTYLATAPAAGNIVSVEDFTKTNGYPYADYRVVVAHSCNLYSVFIHVGKLVGSAAAIVAKINQGGTWTGSIPVKSGEAIADDSANPGFDYSLFDQTKPLKGFANLASYSQKEQWKRFTADLLTHLPASLRASYEAKYQSVTAPIGGKIDWDVPGTAQGNWFVKGTNGYRGLGTESANFNNHGTIAHGYWDTHLAIAPEAVDRNTTIFSIGDWAGCPCQFVSKDPSITGLSIKASSNPTVVELVEPMYQSPGGQAISQNELVKGYKIVPSDKVLGLLALQLQSDGSLKVEKLPGVTDKTQFNGFSSAAQVYTH